MSGYGNRCCHHEETYRGSPNLNAVFLNAETVLIDRGKSGIRLSKICGQKTWIRCYNNDHRRHGPFGWNGRGGRYSHSNSIHVGTRTRSSTGYEDMPRNSLDQNTHDDPPSRKKAENVDAHLTYGLHSRDPRPVKLMNYST